MNSMLVAKEARLRTDGQSTLPGEGVSPPIAPSASGVSCRHVRKTFGAGESVTHALRGVSVDFAAGQTTLLVGPSGCGKTTLISVIAGLLEPTSGDVSLFGQSLDKMTSAELVAFRARQIGFVFQQYNLLPALTAAENAAVPLLVRGVARAKAVRRAAEVLDAVGLGSRIQSYPSQLSGGQQQRVAIARSLVHEPKLLVCDEPTAALDAQSGQTVMQLFRQVAVHPDRVVIIVTHDNRVFGYGDRMVEMNDGQITSMATGQAQ